MGTPDDGELWGDGVRISPPRLHELDFSYAGADPPEGPWNTEYELSLHRPGPLQLGVQFGVAIADIPDLKLRAAYRMLVTLEEGSPEADDAERAFRIFAARLAPVAMYPFIRETVMSVLQKSFLPAAVLPIKNVGALWSPDEVEVPEVEEDSGALEPE